MSLKRKQRSEGEGAINKVRKTDYPLLFDGDKAMKARFSEVPPKSSSFLVSCSTNKTEASLEQEYMEASMGDLRKFKAEYFLATLNALENKENYKPKKDLDLTTEDLISISVVSGSWEVGKINKRLHLHWRVEVIYNGASHGYFNVDWEKVQTEIREIMPEIDWGDGPYINSRYISSAPERSVTNYINKETAKDPEFSLIRRSHELQKERRRSRNGANETRHRG